MKFLSNLSQLSKKQPAASPMKRLILFSAILHATMLVSLASINGLGSATTARAAVLNQDSPSQSSCTADVSRNVSPGFILRGETATVQLQAELDCEGISLKDTHIVLVLEASEAMTEAEVDTIKQSVLAFIQDLDLAMHPSRQIGIVQFGAKARELCELTNNANLLRDCVGRVARVGAGPTDVATDQGIAEGVELLRSERGGASGAAANEILIVLSMTASDFGCSSVLRAAGLAKGQGILVIAVCIGESCDTTCMRQVASSGRYSYEVGNDPGDLDLEATMLQISLLLDRLQKGWRQVRITETIPESIELVQSSLSSSFRYDEQGRELTWTAILPPDSLSFSYEIRPMDSGQLATNGASKMDFRDPINRSVEVVLPVGRIMVLGR